MTPRQQKAKDLADEIAKLGGHVISNCPPSEGDCKVLFQIEPADADKALPMLREWGWELISRGYGLRFFFDGTTRPVSSYEIRVPHERIPVQGDGKQYFGPLSQPQDRDAKSEYELQRMQHYLGIKK